MTHTKEIDALLPESQFADAKSHLSELMNLAVQHRRPQVVNRHRGRDRAVLVDARDLAGLLERHTFEPQVSVVDGDFVIRLPELNVIAGGSSLDEAATELIEVAEEYAVSYLERVDFYLQTDRREHLPWILRIALTSPDARRELIAPTQPSVAGSEIEH